jgi:signal peptidase I
MPTKSKPSPKSKKKPETLKEKIYHFIKEFVVVFGIFIVLNSFVIASFEVPTSSMEDTVMAGDFLFVNKFIYNLATPKKHTAYFNTTSLCCYSKFMES